MTMKASPPARLLIAFAGIATDVVTILTLGFYQPPWDFNATVWVLRRRVDARRRRDAERVR